MSHFVNRSNQGVVNVLASQCEICTAFHPTHQAGQPHPKLEQFAAIWDTGATRSVITQDVVTRCGLVQTGVAQVHHADGTSITSTYLVNIKLPNSVEFVNMLVTLGKLPPGTHALIGMDIISRGDFFVTIEGGSTKFGYRFPSQGMSEFGSVAQSGTVVGRNDPCHCGSGKKFKKCHGAATAP